MGVRVVVMERDSDYAVGYKSCFGLEVGSVEVGSMEWI